MTYICTNPHTLRECPTGRELFRKDGLDVTACNNVRYILYNVNPITSIAK